MPNIATHGAHADKTKAVVLLLMSLHPGFSSTLWGVTTDLGHSPVWIITLVLANFSLPLQVNEVFLRTCCHDLCHGAVGY